VTPLGQLPFFTEYLKVSGLFDPWVEECPLRWTSPNAPKKRDVLGTALLSILSGHRRYAHISALRGEDINAKLLGMSKVVSEDSVRGSFAKLDETKGNEWLQRHLHHVYAPLLSVPWILDADVTIKPLYGHQEGAELGYNPHKPGRPSHTYHTFLIANLRLVLDVEVQPGNQHHSKFSAPGLWHLLERIGRARWPRLLRGDRDWGTEGNMQRCEQEGLDDSFKQPKTQAHQGTGRALVARCPMDRCRAGLAGDRGQPAPRDRTAQWRRRCASPMFRFPRPRRGLHPLPGRLQGHSQRTAGCPDGRRHRPRSHANPADAYRASAQRPQLRNDPPLSAGTRTRRS
jgi:hypothetical protein